MVIKKVKGIAQNSCKLILDLPVLVGFSGGADSLCLLHTLHRAGYRVVAAHLDHGLRVGSDQDAEQAGKLARDLGVPFISDRVPVKEVAESRHISIEAAAREVRYRFLFAQASKFGAQAVAVGHTADDQVETILMHLLRGAGLQGLQGMTYQSFNPGWGSQRPLVRPLLDIWRSETRAYCESLGLCPIEDPSNQERDYLRNRVRLDLIPFLSSFNPQIKQAVRRLGVTAAVDYAYIDTEVNRVWPVCLISEREGYLAFDWQALTQLHPALLSSLLHRALARLQPGGEAVELGFIQHVLAFLASTPHSGQADLAAGLRLEKVNDPAGQPAQLVISPWNRSEPGLDGPEMEETLQSLPLPGQIDLGHGWTLTAEVETDFNLSAVPADKRADPFQAWLDVGDATELVVRTRRNGDRFMPFGLGGHNQKLSDFMVNARLPVRMRARWPLVCLENRIAWIPGYRIAHPFRLEGSTCHAVHLSLCRIP
jgi:tRNA(Ile)-lysidine synthase